MLRQAFPIARHTGGEMTALDAKMAHQSGQALFEWDCVWFGHPAILRSNCEMARRYIHLGAPTPINGLP
jgi:hypothetical protein